MQRLSIAQLVLRARQAGQGARRLADSVRADGARHGTDVLAGLVAALVTIAHCLSFSVLIFHGELKTGLPFGLWAFMAGATVTGIVVALTTTLPPAIAGPRNPAVAVMSVLAGIVSAQVLAAGGSGDLAARHVLLGLTLATLVTGAALYLVGALRLGQMVRFVPYPVIGGFLAASGWLLVTGGVKVITGRNFDLASPALSMPSSGLPKIALALAFALGVLALRQRVRSTMLLPAAFFGGALVLDLMLWLLGAGDRAWYVTGATEMSPWLPFGTALSGEIDWRIFLRASAEIGAIAGVTLIALLLDISSLEVTRARVANLDVEFRANGLANIVAAPLGGLSANLSLNPSRLLEETGSRARASGLYGALSIGLVMLAGIDLASLIPTPLLGGLLMYLGILVLTEALWRSPARRSWTELGLALAIMFAIVQFGYLPGVVLGLIGACLMFALSYSRIGVIRRHLTRTSHASNVVRAPEASALLTAQGERIHVFWLSGFIFFGSSNGVFEDIRAAVRGGRCYVLLDLSSVTGFDTSAILSFIKLVNWAKEGGLTLVWAGLSAPMRAAFEEARLFGAGQEHPVFQTRTEALEWCEERLLDEAHIGQSCAAADAFETWLAREIGEEASRQVIAIYLERRALDGGETLYAQGGPSDTIDLVASGSVAVSVIGADGRSVRVRRMTGHTVVGEMGFFRAVPRTASVVAEGATVVYVLSRAGYEQMLRHDPDLGARFLQFIVRALSDRVEFANKEISALL